MNNTIDGLFHVSLIMFDLDGTLIDSIDFYFKLVETVLAKLGLPQVSKGAIHAAVEDGRFHWHRILPHEKRANADALVEKMMPLAKEVYPKIFREGVVLFKGVPQLLGKLNALGIKTAIVTATPADHMAEKYRLLENSGVAAFIATVVTNDDAPNPKPAPDTLLECCRRLSIDPRYTLYVGDTALDIKAGKAAGASTVGVLTGFDDRATLANEKPNALLNDVTELHRYVVKQSQGKT